MDKTARNKSRREKTKRKKAAIRSMLGDTTKITRRLARTALAAEMADNPKWAAAIQDPTIIGAGAYNFMKAYNGKNAAAKRSSAISRAVDIGGRSLQALSQFGSGDYLGAAMTGSKILGKGDYTLARNSVVSDITSPQIPYMHSSKESIRFRHREFISDVYAPNTTNFSSIVYNLNPGLASTFPFLAAIAQQFQEYRFQGLAFEFKSTSAVSLSSTAGLSMGTVMMASQYRASAPAFADKQTMMNEMWSVDGRPSDCFMLPIECAPDESPLDTLYIRGGSLPATDDIKFFDLAKLTLATQGIPVNASNTSQIIGELWVTYDVELFKPLISSNTNSFEPLCEILTSAITFNASFPWQGNATCTVPFNNMNFQVLPNTFAYPLNSNVGYIQGTTIVFPIGTVGSFLIQLNIVGTAAVTTYNAGYASGLTVAYTAPTTGVTTGIAGNYGFNVLRTITGAAGGSTTVWHLSLYINIPNPSVQAIVQMSGSNGYPTGAASSTSLVITAVNGNIS